jgi:2-polyprenyl-3-methyl-5-hydroxy-6-metoxy-1,4-benzoquinol methylase
MDNWTLAEISDGDERITHLYPNDCYYAHLSLYRFALQFATDALILDAGCGAGYGTHYLAERGARFVRGIDVSARAIAFCREHFCRPNLEYRVVDLQSLDRFTDGPLDLLFTSNVLEHLPNVPAFLWGAWRLLKRTGVMVVAVPPIVDAARRAANIENPYHLNIWSPRQWEHVLRMYFAEVQPYQHLVPAGMPVDFLHTPEQTVIRETDFVFEPVAETLSECASNLTALYVVRCPVPREQLPSPEAPLSFVDDSFTRPLLLPNRSAQPAVARPWWRLPRRAWEVVRQEGFRGLLSKTRRFFRTR